MQQSFRPTSPARLAVLVHFAALALILAVLIPRPARAEMPFAPGERLTYDIYWTFVHAGEASMEMLADTTLDGVPARHFRAFARTTPFVDNFYKVRDQIDSWTDMDLTRTLRYRFRQHEGHYEKDALVVFDWTLARSRRYTGNTFQHELFHWPPKAYDPFVVAYAFRLEPLHPDYRFDQPVTDGKKRVEGTAHVVGRERVKTALGEFDCYKVVPDLADVGGVFRKSPGASIEVWVTADERRLPVKIRSKVAVGHFTLELKRVEQLDAPRNPSPAPGDEPPADAGDVPANPSGE